MVRPYSAWCDPRQISCAVCRGPLGGNFAAVVMAVLAACGGSTVGAFQAVALVTAGMRLSLEPAQDKSPAQSEACCWA